MPDSQPNYLSTDASGKVTAEFSGGVIMPMSPGAPYSAGSAVAWVDVPGGAKLAYVQGSAPSASERDIIASITSPTRSQAASLRLATDTSRDLATVIATATNSTGGSLGQTLIDSGSNSDYLQIGQFNPKRSTVIRALFTWPGGTPFSNLLDLSPLAGFTVRAIVGTGPGDWGAANFICTPFHPNASNNIAQASCTQAGALVSPGAGQTNSAYIIVTS